MSFPVGTIAPLEAARQFIEKISKSALILVAVSGGSDSTGLLFALRQAVQDAGRRDISFHAVTIDHRLRPEAAVEAKGVAALCASIGVTCHIRHWNDAKPTSGISAAARLARYALITDVADEIGADMVVLGHTFGDQQETIAMRSARSVRADNLGLAGMADAVLYNRRHWIMRPFLQSTRQDIRNFLTELGQSWYDDPSNDDSKYERVRARTTASAFSGMLIDQSINRFELSTGAAHLIENHVLCDSGSVFTLKADALEAEPATLRYALSALACVAGGRRFSMAADSMDRVMTLVTSGEPGRVTAARVVFDRRRHALHLVRENRGIQTMRVASGQHIVWDERFDITNGTAKDFIVRAHGPLESGTQPGLTPSVPAGVARLALETMPVIEDGNMQATALEGVELSRMIAPYDLFLPRFDLQLANSIAALIGREAYPQAPA